MGRARAKLVEADLFAYIEETIPDFHAARLASLGRLKLRDLVRSKNPYLFRAKNVLVASELVQGFMAAHLSSQEEGIFGTFLEKLAIYVATTLWRGQKSPAEGIDLDATIRGGRYLITIKSGPDWGTAVKLRECAIIFGERAKYSEQTRKRSPSFVLMGAATAA
jgi:hypothetical protein